MREGELLGLGALTEEAHVVCGWGMAVSRGGSHRVHGEGLDWSPFGVVSEQLIGENCRNKHETQDSELRHTTIQIRHTTIILAEWDVIIGRLHTGLIAGAVLSAGERRESKIAKSNGKM